jgi:membrane-associated protein
MNVLVDWLLANLLTYGAPLLLLVTFIGSLGIPFPITLVLIATGAFARQGLLDGRVAVIAILAGAMLADHCEYLLGRLAQSWLKQHVEQKRAWQPALATFNRQGGWAILLTRLWLMPLAPAINVIAGSRTPYARFLLFDLCGELLWILLYGGTGYLFSSQWKQVSQLIGQFGSLSLVLVLLAAGFVFYGKRILPQLGQTALVWAARVRRWILALRLPLSP